MVPNLRYGAVTINPQRCPDGEQERKDKLAPGEEVTTYVLENHLNRERSDEKKPITSGPISLGMLAFLATAPIRQSAEKKTTR
jgi:hypothetical protein